MSFVHMITLSSNLILFFILTCNFDHSESRSLLNDNFYPGTFAKRNSWWSKKSLDNLPSSVKDKLTSDVEPSCDSALNVFKCYTSYCVPDFVSCTNNANSDDVYQMCKVEHGVCASKCYDDRSEDSGFIR